MRTLAWTRLGVLGLTCSLSLAAAAVAIDVDAQEPLACLSPNPGDWPAASKPYFMLAFDTSGSMTTNVTGSATDSCGWGTSRLTHGKCAVRNTILAYSGQVNFGLMTYARRMTGCSASCYSNCSYSNVSNNSGNNGCGPEPSCGLPNSGCRAGALIRVPMLQDTTPPQPSNVTELLSWVDDDCTGSVELFASGNTPINGIIRDAFRYYSVQWTPPSPTPGGPTLASPLTSIANGERDCRSVNVILLTDGDETCDTDPADPNDAILDLYNGFTKDGITWNVRTHVINFAGGDITKSNQFADLGDDGVDNNSKIAFLATNETSLAQALSSIIAGTVAPEVCDNKDNNCNGCTDEGYTHYCNVAQACCAWSTQAQRTTCLNNYQASISPSDPDGDLTLLPCTTAAQATQPTNWLCYDPKETCDDVDNNCSAGVDEGVLKCGSPLHCPQTEVCNGQDDDCDGLTDENVCSGCIPSPEVCDGCDNDCDGRIDEGISSVPCGQSSPANCTGQLTCSEKANPGGVLGACTAGGWNQCSNSPQPEVCDGIDNDCDGIIDDGVPAVSCVPAGTPGGLVYGGTSQCRQGTQECGGSCVGFMGPSPEICDGVDNDCDGQVDEQAFGVGQSCGISQPPCTPGITACVNGALVCQGGVSPQPEVCDGIDNNCNGSADEAPLADGPGAGQNGCWTLAGNCCSFQSLDWCPPAGATCYGNGALSSPCNRGTLTCSGAGGWSCIGSTVPSAETCDNIDNNCDGAIDNNIAQVGQPCGTNTGECTAGTFQCSSGSMSCIGSVGSTIETCNGLDDDCDGIVDNNIGGLGVACGNATPPCAPGVTACAGGQVVCQGGVKPSPETCNGVDDDCDGVVDDAPLSDAPQVGQTGCWNLSGNCCTFANLSWCPPAGGTCSGEGVLTPPCDTGAITCAAGGWTCAGGTLPSIETCDNVDNDCNGSVDDMPAVECVPAGTPSNLVYGGTSQCKKGQQTCGGCAGFVGPTSEICDEIDNDCDGAVDDNPVGAGAPCGFSKPPCTLGQTQCVAGVLTCLGGVQPEPEVCDGIDNNCNGSIDESPLADAPLAGQNGCWADAGSCCTFQNLSWCPPANATCDGNGTLTAPCNKGFISCSSGTWACMNPKGPASEVCDGIDNNCNGSKDEGDLPGTGDTCGSDIGECRSGTIICANGILDCDGDIPPTAEVCDGLDNNCNAAIDDGIATGGPCAVAYDTTQYPGNRTQGACQVGVAECDGNGGLKCEGGIGPQPEICDGIDNDCDGLVDEDSTKQPSGGASDVIDGTANPTGNPMANVGQSCGVSEGACEQGQWGCRYGVFACLGGKGPEPEQCDCMDNDCDGVIDNENDPLEPALCGTGKKCVTTGNGCQCAAPCKGGEFPCSGGQECEEVNLSETGELAGSYCIVDVDLCGGDCSDKTVKDSNGATLCAPAGTDPAGCLLTPVCVCLNNYGCNEPCFNVSCGSGDTCAKFGTNAGKCVTDTCWQTGCSGCDQACNQGACVDNPCKPDTCKPDEACKPNPTFTSPICVKSCAQVTCESNQKCVDGICAPWCDPPCDSGNVCDPSTLECTTSKCASGDDTCTNGSCCDPLTGTCGNCPCEGVLCPEDQRCESAECIAGGGGDGGSAGTGGAGGAGGGAGSGGSGGATTGGAGGSATGGSSADPDAGPPDNSVWGLATGGGGCACRVGAIPQKHDDKLLFLAGLAAALLSSRRGRGGKRTGAKGGAR